MFLADRPHEKPVTQSIRNGFYKFIMSCSLEKEISSIHLIGNFCIASSQNMRKKSAKEPIFPVILFSK